MSNAKLIGSPFLAIVDVDGKNLHRENCVYIVRDYMVPQGYHAYLLSSNIPEEYAKNLASYCPNASILYDVQNIEQYGNYDVIDVDNGGRIRIAYQDSSEDNVLFITNQCNSNCIMCPDSNAVRKRISENRKEYLDHLIELIPSDAIHLTITGGEPTLLKWDFIDILKKCQGKFTQTEFLMLSNGRTLANTAYRNAFLDALPNYFRLAVPLYAASSDAHDLITRAPGSFEQTVTALKALQHRLNIEIRIVVMKETYTQLPKIASYLVSNFPHIKTVSIMGLELLGNAAANRKNLWIDFHSTAKYIEDAVHILLTGGIDARIYNYPLCALPRSLWSISAKSITGYKIRYPEKCNECIVKNLCGGFFFSTLHFADIHVNPILEE